MEKKLNFSQEQKDEIKCQYSLLRKTELSERERPITDGPRRNKFQRDYARVLYSPSFRRLQGKMQIVGIKSSAFYRNRLTHSLEVAQIATSIAHLLAISVDDTPEMYINDIHLIEAAALAHDIGHPAFGHKGERVLNELGKEYGLHFEGNAHNFRVLRHIERKEPGQNGLNLTNRTLLAINKYIVEESDDVKKFMFKGDYEYLMGIRNKVEGLSKRRTLDVQIIELADDIAYAVHDLEDGLALRNFTINEIMFQLRQKSEKAYRQFKKIVVQSCGYASLAENVQDHSKLFRMSLTSKLTHMFIYDITVKTISEEMAKKNGTEIYPELALGEYEELVKFLKEATFECTTRDNHVQLYEARGEIVLKELFELYSNPEIDEDGKLMPPDFRTSQEYKKIDKGDLQGYEEYKKELAQNAIDYIAGMMDTYAIEEYERLFNKKFSEIDVNQLISPKSKSEFKLEMQIS